MRRPQAVASNGGHATGLGRTATERRLARRTLERWLEASSFSGAALYVADDGGLRREVVTGEGDFPRYWPPEGAPDELTSWELEGGLLVASGDGEPPGDEVLRLALIASSHAVLLAEELRQQRFAVSYHDVELQALYDLGLAIASTLELTPLGEEILLHAVSLLDARRGALYLVREAGLRLQQTLAGDARAEAELQEPQIQALLAGRVPEEQDLLPGARYLAGAVIGENGPPRGLLVVADKESRSGIGPFSDSDRQTLSLFANQAAIALETAELHRQALEKEGLERELELASEIQRRLLPTQSPDVLGYEIHGWSRPARQVGGDYYDLLPLSDEELGLVLGDVSGKGMPAALMVSTLHAGLKLLAGRQPDATEIMERFNQYLFQSSASNRFATLIFARLERMTGRLRFVNAGHNPGLLLHPDGGIDRLPAGGLPLGLLSQTVYREQAVMVAPGDLLCLYSDGITEAASERGEEFGEQRLAELLRTIQSAPLSGGMREIRQRMDCWAGEASQADDQTVLLLRRTPATGNGPDDSSSA
jgi:sigma-B regulation protein RsbU (phosphoserine phosphatase)